MKTNIIFWHILRSVATTIALLMSQSCVGRGCFAHSIEGMSPTSDAQYWNTDGNAVDAMVYPNDAMTAAYLSNTGGTLPILRRDNVNAFSSMVEPMNNNERALAYNPDDGFFDALTADSNMNEQELNNAAISPEYGNVVRSAAFEAVSKLGTLAKLEEELRDEEDIVSKSTVLVKMLENPNLDVLPIIYVEENSNNPEIVRPSDGNGVVFKRSRYYRRYPWKRHNKNRSTYQPQLRYACTPTKEDIFKLLVNLHENRKGNGNKTVRFCHRKRPAKDIFTNIRFLG